MERSITDDEISLIKAMLARGERNVDIQFYFNRQDRPVNSGRISGIRNCTYGPDVPEANEKELEDFLSSFKSIEVGVAGGKQIYRETLEDRAKALFEKNENGIWYLRDGETATAECKESFSGDSTKVVLKTIAGMANNMGGFLFFGVGDNDCEVVGLSDDLFEEYDISRVTQQVKNYLTPTPNFVKKSITIYGKTVGFFYVEQYEQPPIIICKDGEKIESGAIYFRSPGQTSKISFGDLQALLHRRDKFSQSKILNLAQRVTNIVAEHSYIIDTKGGTIEGEDTKFLIDRSLADQLEFIRQGEFEEVEGAPTLRLIGDVRAIDVEGQIRERIEERALTADAAFSAFICKEPVRSPEEFIKLAANVQRHWLPLYYFIEQLKISVSDAIKILEDVNPVYSASRNNALQRLRGEKSAYQSPTQAAQSVLDKIMTGKLELNVTNSTSDVRNISLAIMALPDNFNNIAYIHDILEKLLNFLSDDASLKGFVFKAAARLDEIEFRPLK